jgi:hypothetical protein
MKRQCFESAALLICLRDLTWDIGGGRSCGPWKSHSIAKRDSTAGAGHGQIFGAGLDDWTT